MFGGIGKLGWGVPTGEGECWVGENEGRGGIWAICGTCGVIEDICGICGGI